ncbi:MAG: hypothetical protein K8T26_09515 [Lentisphaerae bacterium]|nr:hypothetical protein [Lentisphaerota bacterium]
MNTPEPRDEAQKPLALWLGLIRYYGALVARPGWEHLHPLFDLVKQISTSQTCAAVYPTLVNDVLTLTRQPLGDPPAHQPRLTLELTESRQFLFKQFEADSETYRDLICDREHAFNILVQIVRTL